MLEKKHPEGLRAYAHSIRSKAIMPFVSEVKTDKAKVRLRKELEMLLRD
jgi:hypothetical protein